MGFLNKALEFANNAATSVKSGVDEAKKKYEQQKAEDEAKAYAQENIGLSQEEIVEKDNAKKLIEFSELKLCAYASDGTHEYHGNKSMIGKSGVRLALNENGSKNIFYSNEPGLIIHTINNGTAQIKYIHVFINGINKVGDVIDTEQFTITGPINAGQKSKSLFGNAFKQSVENIDLSKVVIEYFEGNAATLEGKWLNVLVRK